MRKVNTEYTVSVTPSNGFSTISVFKNKATCLSLNIKEQFTKIAVKVLEAETDLIVRLKDGPIQMNLFEEKRFSDFIQKEWMHTVSALSSIQIEKALLESIWAKKNDEVAGALSVLKEASDEELLAKIANVLTGEVGGQFVTIEGQVGSKEILSIDYTEILLALRNKYQIESAEAIDLDDYLLASLEEYLQEHIGTPIELKEVAYDSANAEMFASHVVALAATCPGKRMSGEEILCGNKDGFSASGIAGLREPNFSVSYLGVCAHHNGLEGFGASTQTVYRLNGDDFWETAWYELCRGFEMHVIGETQKLVNKHKARIIMLEKMMKEAARKIASKEATTLTEDFNMSQQDIAKTLGGMSASTVGNIQKKALGIMLKAFQEKGLDLKDLLCA